MKTKRLKMNEILFNNKKDLEVIYDLFDTILKQKFIIKNSYIYENDYQFNLIKEYCDKYGFDYDYNLKSKEIMILGSSPLYLNKLKVLCKELILAFDNNEPDKLLELKEEIKNLMEM